MQRHSTATIGWLAQRWPGAPGFVDGALHAFVNSALHARVKPPRAAHERRRDRGRWKECRAQLERDSDSEGVNAQRSVSSGGRARHGKRAKRRLADISREVDETRPPSNVRFQSRHTSRPQEVFESKSWKRLVDPSGFPYALQARSSGTDPRTGWQDDKARTSRNLGRGMAGRSSTRNTSSTSARAKYLRFGDRPSNAKSKNGLPLVCSVTLQWAQWEEMMCLDVTTRRERDAVMHMFERLRATQVSRDRE